VLGLSKKSQRKLEYSKIWDENDDRFLKRNKGKSVENVFSI
jgi:hypothetical protein